ncbi:MAG TPA: ADYC domain-containing protein [Myxococcaceae bacterium]|jgi:hypothetical protein
MNPQCFTAAALVILTGCGPAPGPEVEADSPLPMSVSELNGTSVAPGAPSLTGCFLTDSVAGEPMLMGCSNNGPLLGSTLAFVSLESITAPDGSAVDVAALQGSHLTGRVNGVQIGSEAFVGARFNATVTDGSQMRLQLDGAVPGHSGSQEGVWRYDFSYLDSMGQWKPLCDKTHDGAVVVSGRWDYHQGARGDGSKTDDRRVFTIGCQGSAIEKCIVAGYEPWASAGGVSLDAYHQACVRMMRADYCGDGVSHTTRGRQVNLYDTLGLEVDGKPWVKEAEWTASGARCLNPANLTMADAPCISLLGSSSCGEPSNVGADTLIVSETKKTGGRDGH